MAVKGVQYDASHMRTMQGLEHIRALPEMYIKSRDTHESLIQIFKEVFDNVADEYRANPGQRATAEVVFFRKGQRYQILLRDQGRGVPITKIKDAFTEPRTSGKFDGGGSYIASTGVFGVGAKATAGLSSRFVAISHRPEGFGMVEVIRGNVKRSEVIKSNECKNVHIDNSFSQTGTIVFFEPDSSILSTTHEYMDGPGYAGTIALLEFMSTYVPEMNVRVFVVDNILTEANFAHPAVELWNYLSTVGLDGALAEIPKFAPTDYVKYVYGLKGTEVWNTGKLHKALTTTGARNIEGVNYEERLGYDIELFMTKDFEHHTGIVSAVNMTLIGDPQAYQTSGLLDAIKHFVQDQIEDKDMRTFFTTTYKLPISGSIMVKYQGAIFVGQTKDSFKDRQFLLMYRAALLNQLSGFSELFWENFYELIREDIVDKYNKFAQKDLRVSKDLKNAAYMMQSKYVPCRSSDSRITELLIAEGVSAGDYVAQVRDTDFQAVFQLKGKPINAMRIPSSKLMANTIFKDLVRILGVRPSDTDLSNMNFARIGILTDADPDGYHICSLLIGCLLKINPLILAQGRVFIANPPLYTMTVKNSSVFIRDNKALMDMRINMIYRYATELTIRGNTKQLMKLEGENYRAFCYLIRHIGGIIKRVGNKLVIDPLILESLIHCVEHLKPGQVNTQAIAKVLGLKSVIHHPESNSIILNAGVEITIPLSNLYQEIITYILPELEAIHWNDIEIWCTTPYNTSAYRNSPVSIMQLFNIFDAIDMAYPIHRLKGLGEMKKAQLKTTCTDPETRSQTIVTSIGDVSQLYAMLGIDVTARKSLIENDLAAIDPTVIDEE